MNFIKNIISNNYSLSVYSKHPHVIELINNYNKYPDYSILEGEVANYAYGGKSCLQEMRLISIFDLPSIISKSGKYKTMKWWFKYSILYKSRLS